MGKKKNKTKKQKAIKHKALEHRMIPLHLFHNENIDRWIVLMRCNSCNGQVHIFYPPR